MIIDSNVFNSTDDKFDLEGLLNFLDGLSYESKLGKNLKNTLRKFDKGLLFNELEDLQYFYYENLLVGCKYIYRVKSLQSLYLKYNKYYPSKEVKSCFNDVLGFRILVDSLDSLYCDLNKITNSNVHIADLRNGKQVDDGYRAIHLYYQKSNYHYPIEVQFWNKSDYNFHIWCHKYVYKYLDSRLGLLLRGALDKGLLVDEQSFVNVLDYFKKELKK